MSSRTMLLAALLVTSGLAGCVDLAQQGDDQEPVEGTGPDDGQPGTVEIAQEEGGLVYWVLPGPRTLGEASWGTPEHPKNTLAAAMDDIRDLPEPYDETVDALVQEVPIVAGLPMEARATNEDNTSFTQTKMGTPVSDEGRIVDGSFQMTLQDRAPWDLPTKFADPTDTPDEVEATATFTDPAGNQYELTVDHLRQWTWQENGAGVVTNGFIHGDTGIDSPLFPRAFTYGAFWGVGTVAVNGDVVHGDQWIHFMTTQIVRDSDYGLATQDDLPLELEETIAGQPHHTHVIVRPIQATEDGPVFNPVETGFQLPNGNTQPFIHAMFEQDRILSGPFADEPDDPWIDAE